MSNPDPFEGQPADKQVPPPPPPGYTPPGYGPPQYGQQPPYGPPATGVGQPGTLVDRFVARLIDGLIVGVVAAIINFILGSMSNSWFLTNFVTAVVSAVLYLGYFAYFESNQGQTLGKQVMKLRVYGPDHASNPTMEQSIRRNIYMGFGILGIVPVVGALIGGLAELAAVILVAANINSDPQRQHWFDKFAGGTQVIKIG
ncbi:RDD family protein [Actinoplanes sp. HUAS TT8]|uniref:RDD family protein n=1 Tax=Actinoplanes sp. HUAS TT8 TaxID=3447453 RepID=UPI003F524985